MLTGCGGSDSSNTASGGSGGSSGAGGSASGGVGASAGSGGASGSAGSAGASGSAGTAGNAGAAGGGGLSCVQPTPGCTITDDNILGPFYSPGAPERTDIRDGQTGERVVVRGTVYGCDCKTPLANAIVDVWQANSTGAYDNVGFVLRGTMKTDSQGRYEYTTILPGFYLNGANYRPRHIHYKVSHPSGLPLTTQLYFEGDPNFGTDAFWKPGLIKALVPDSDSQGKLLRCEFDIVLG